MGTAKYLLIDSVQKYETDRGETASSNKGVVESRKFLIRTPANAMAHLSRTALPEPITGESAVGWRHSAKHITLGGRGRRRRQ